MKYLSLMALLNLSLMAELFTTLLSSATLKKSSTCFSKFLNNFIEEILLEINFVEERITTGGKTAVPEIFLHKSRYSRKYDLIRLTPYQTVTSQQA